MNADEGTSSFSQEQVAYKSVLVSGFVSKASNIAQPFVLSKLFEKGTFESIVTTTDDTKFARKRLVDPSSVYSGLIDMLEYAEVNDKSSLQTSISGKEVWLAYGLVSSDLAEYSSMAVNAGLKRVVFAVKVTEEEAKASDLVFGDICSSLSNAGIQYTIIKYSIVTAMSEAKFPYRITRGSKPLPEVRTTPLSSDDLMRVLVEVVDLPKTFNSVYGIGPGTQLDTEILVYMKAQGWPERVQVGLLMGDMMEKIEKSYEAEKSGAALKAQQSSNDKSNLPKVTNLI